MFTVQPCLRDMASALTSYRLLLLLLFNAGKIPVYYGVMASQKKDTTVAYDRPGALSAGTELRQPSPTHILPGVVAVYLAPACYVHHTVDRNLHRLE